jgi:hypothetical protein
MCSILDLVQVSLGYLANAYNNNRSRILVTMSQLPLPSDFLACELSVDLWLDSERLKTIKLSICYLFCMEEKARL